MAAGAGVPSQGRGWNTALAKAATFTSDSVTDRLHSHPPSQLHTPSLQKKNQPVTHHAPYYQQ